MPSCRDDAKKEISTKEIGVVYSSSNKSGDTIMAQLISISKEIPFKSAGKAQDTAQDILNKFVERYLLCEGSSIEDKKNLLALSSQKPSRPESLE